MLEHDTRLKFLRFRNETIAAYETVHHNGALAAETTRYHSLTSLFQTSEYSVLMSLNALNAMQNMIFVTGIILISSLSAYHISIGVHKGECLFHWKCA